MRNERACAWHDVRAEAAFPRLVARVLGDAGVPWTWEYGAMRFVK